MICTLSGLMRTKKWPKRKCSIIRCKMKWKRCGSIWKKRKGKKNSKTNLSQFLNGTAFNFQFHLVDEFREWCALLMALASIYTHARTQTSSFRSLQGNALQRFLFANCLVLDFGKHFCHQNDNISWFVIGLTMVDIRVVFLMHTWKPKHTHTDTYTQLFRFPDCWYLWHKFFSRTLKTLLHWKIVIKIIYEQ